MCTVVIDEQIVVERFIEKTAPLRYANMATRPLSINVQNSAGGERFLVVCLQLRHSDIHSTQVNSRPKLLTKIISIGVIPFYALILTFMVHFGNATAIMFAIIILGSVAVTTIYGAFRGSKLCLVPFIFLQVVFFIYDLVLLGLFSIALLRSEKSASLVYTIYVTDSVSPQIVLLVTSIVLLCALVPILWIAYVVYLDILFIAELDRGLEFMRELNENASNDDATPKLNNF
ncbi:hypothetical protein Aduo_019911 [Ancylostoma duodenale]